MIKILFLLSLIISPSLNAKKQSSLIKQSIFIDGKFRSYLLYVPKHLTNKEQLQKQIPALFMLHGGGGNAKKTANSTGLHNKNNAKDWIVVYPQATRHRFKSNWNDGRVHTQKGKQNLKQINDVKYILSILNSLKQKYSIDDKRIYLTGISNGAFMAQKIAAERSDTFAAIAAVIGSMSESVAKYFQPTHKTSVLMINGTQDPLVPYAGGMTKFGQHKLGSSLAVEEVVNMWVKYNQLNPQPEIKHLHNKALTDHCQIEQRVYSTAKNNVEVILLKLHGSGHTVAGNKQYAPVKLIGYTCQDINAYDYIIEFLTNHSKLEFGK